jgi:hypothetical protein
MDRGDSFDYYSLYHDTIPVYILDEMTFKKLTPTTNGTTSIVENFKIKLLVDHIMENYLYS